jgi:hypothetical protein
MGNERINELVPSIADADEAQPHAVICSQYPGVCPAADCRQTRDSGGFMNECATIDLVAHGRVSLSRFG